MIVGFQHVNSLTTKKADDKIFVCKFSKNINSKLYHIENSNIHGRSRLGGLQIQLFSSLVLKE